MGLERDPDVSARIRILSALVPSPRTFSEIVEKTGLSGSTVSKWLTILKAQGHVDRRHGRYYITEKGLALLAALIAEAAQLERVLTRAFTAHGRG